ncbi:forkhead box protein J1-A-like [Rhizophagus clarus]|nr:forkhead box protein J1-A-like [Rhizophagus clarus]
MEEVLNGRLHLGQRSFSSENHILQDDITEKSSYNKRDKSCKELCISSQQAPMQTFQWPSQDLSQNFRANGENLKFDNESIVTMGEIYNNSNRNRGNNLSKKSYTFPYSLHFNHNTFPVATNQFPENRFSCLDNEIQTLFLDERNFIDKSKDYVPSIFPISFDEENNVMQNRNQSEGKVLANNFDYTNKIGIDDSEYQIKKLTEKQLRSIKENLAAESLVTLQTSKEENELLQSPKDQRTQNKKNGKTKQKAHNEQNQADKENDQNLNTKNLLSDQILYDMFIKSGLTMEDVLKFKEDGYKNQKNDDIILNPAAISMQTQIPATINMSTQLQIPVPVPNPFQSPAPISPVKIKLPKTKPANMSEYRSKPIPILPANYHPYLIREVDAELNTQMNGFIQEKHQRPGYSYASMIGQAIMTSSEKKLALADIYSWISKTYPYYKMSDVGWKNSIRHNLSLYSAFIRVPNEGATRSLWMINPEEEQCFVNGVYHYSKRPPGSSRNLRRKSKNTSTKPNVVNENLNSAVQATGTTSNDIIMPMVTSLSYGTMNPAEYFTNQYNIQSCKLLKGEVLSEQSDTSD